MMHRFDHTDHTAVLWLRPGRQIGRGPRARGLQETDGVHKWAEEEELQSDSGFVCLCVLQYGKGDTVQSLFFPISSCQKIIDDDLVFYGIQAPKEVFERYRYLLKVSDACNWSSDQNSVTLSTR